VARRSPNGRPLTGQRLNDTSALVANGICPPQGCYELHQRPSPECMVTDMDKFGTRPDFSDCPNPAPDKGDTLRRTVDYLNKIC
jgi:hypothetical protein